MDNIAQIYDYANNHYININSETNQIPDETLDELLQNHEFYAKFDVLYDDAREECTFYESMVDHPRLNEFIRADVEYMFRDTFGARCQNPKISKGFEEAILSKLCEGIGLPTDLVEEFLHFTRSRKSARTLAGVHAAES